MMDTPQTRPVDPATAQAGTQDLLGRRRRAKSPAGRLRKSLRRSEQAAKWGLASTGLWILVRGDVDVWFGTMHGWAAVVGSVLAGVVAALFLLSALYAWVRFRRSATMPPPAAASALVGLGVLLIVASAAVTAATGFEAVRWAGFAAVLVWLGLRRASADALAD